MNLLVRPSVVHDHARIRDLGDRLFDRLGGDARVETFDRCVQTLNEEDLRLVIATQRPIRSERLVVRVDGLPAKLLEELNRRLLDELVLAVLGWRRRHGATSGTAISRSVTSISPEMRRGRSSARAARRCPFAS